GAGESEIEIDAGGGVRLDGSLNVPVGAWGVVLFVHGSGSSRYSPRNRMVAGRLQDAGMATLLFDLLDPAEERDRANVFDIPLLASRLLAAVRRLRDVPEVRDLPVGFFGASTGAAAALVAAAQPRSGAVAVVSRGGRPDLAADSLPLVRAPTLLIVGGADSEVIDLNMTAMSRMTCHTELRIVPRAGHLFEAPGELEQVADLAVDWFTTQLMQVAGDVTA
ncbi:MAG: dienelactone hydrolase family protein, partial [Thermoleophilia bacterium]|nr:dienelactone hydrolase family protein [Thermoleophilia bacterium]